MLISGNGITTPFTVKIKKYSYNIDLSLNWFKMSDGSYRASDRGFENDHISSKITLHGKNDYIDNIITELKNNQESDGKLVLTNILTPIFGNNIDYTQSCTAVLKNITLKEQDSFNSFNLEIELETDTLVYKTYTLTLPNLSCVKHGYTGDTELQFITNTSYQNANNSGIININTFGNDNGVFKGTFTFTYDELGQLLNFQRINRSASFNLPIISGVNYPFGKLAGNTGLKARLYSISDIEYVSSNLFYVKLEFVQDF